MSGEEGPKLFTNKPKKAKLKQLHHELKQSGGESRSPLTAAARSYTMGAPPPQPPPPPPPPQPPKESFARRYKFLWPLLLTVNLAVGAYLFMRTKKKDTDIAEEELAKDIPSTKKKDTDIAEEEVAKVIPSTPASAVVAVAPVTEKALPLPDKPIAEFVKPRDPILQDQQRELFKWILEEKRKIRPTDPAEKKRIDEEKALLKQFIRAKSIPNI